MPPRIPVRSSWAARSAVQPINAYSSPLCIRAFSSTPTPLALGPESPNYVEVPKPLQPTWPLEPDLKGHLPVPRDVFKTRSKLSKESPKFVARTTKEPAKVKVPGPYSKDGDYRLYKQRLADARRKAFREGVQELHERKVTIEEQHLEKVQKAGAEKRALAMAPPREVDVLTQTSIDQNIRLFLENKLPRTPRRVIVQARRKGFARRMASQDAVRRSHLHDLYTNAREFIVSEAQLDEAIEKAFGTVEKPVRWNNQGSIHPSATGMSPWDGPLPDGISDKMRKLKGGEGVGLAKERVRQVAEVLTGGKI
ncbi:hypothetical protein P280DRAFT_467541 [Massarina eburnea CBS 473.64]|uniref:Uncharacterized protein n=1 Tax=Massarina eburnea CBS 473.64 TaxID=1395130 RepID=A0A6A6S8J3_9PLEO|nr:hypothetical protein P280DRAFT_467541 [Massarina eburnea CBS 473.64]